VRARFDASSAGVRCDGLAGPRAACRVTWVGPLNTVSMTTATPVEVRLVSAVLVAAPDDFQLAAQRARHAVLDMIDRSMMRIGASSLDIERRARTGLSSHAALAPGCW